MSERWKEISRFPGYDVICSVAIVVTRIQRVRTRRHGPGLRSCAALATASMRARSSGGVGNRVLETDGGHYEPKGATGTYIAAMSPDVALALVTRIRELEERNDELRGENAELVCAVNRG